MPRHPPCALKNLNTQNNQKKLQNTKTPHTPPPRPEERKCEVTESSRLRDARVHCTVLKQQPAPHHPHHQRCGIRRPGNPEKTDTPHQSRGWARFLRTQQRVHADLRPSSAGSHSPGSPRPEAGGSRAVLSWSMTRHRVSSQCSTSEPPARGTFVHKSGSLNPSRHPAKGDGGGGLSAP